MQKIKILYKPVLVFLTLAIAIFALYGKTYYYDYSMLDDSLHIEGNRNLLRRNLSTLKKIWTQKYEVVYTPVTYTAWTAIAGLSKASGIKSPQVKKTRFNPGFFHIANVVFHLLTAWMVFLCLSQLSFTLLPSFFGALLYALHPVQVETVIWITGFRDVLAGFFGFTSLYFFLKGIKNPQILKYSFLMLMTFLLSILSKSSGLVVVGFQIITGVFLLKKSWKVVLSYTAPLILASVSFVPIFILFNNEGLSTKTVPPDLIERVLLIIHNTGFYLTKLFLPLNNIFDYGLTPEKVLKTHLYLPYALLLLPLVAFLYHSVKKHQEHKWLAVSLLFLAGFFPVCGIIPFIYQMFSSVADRYLYFSLFAFSLFCAYLLQQKSRLNYIVASVFLAFLTFETTKLIHIWSSNETFYTYILKYNPDSWLAHNNVGVTIEDRKDYEGAYAHYHRAAILSNMAMPWSNAGSMALKMEKFDLAEEIYRKALAASKDSTRAKINLAAALALQGRTDLAREEIANVNVEPLCSNFEMLENKSAIENKDINKLKTLRMDAKF